eukprot:TRINITY_DN75777_c0_g1_i1.p1 TRINITY_DN75777_c0_g1~~TRINITY_DN75777_c0_g1_i1.p1  ORF type:complete len:397 (-),score=75.26 TRINITY_DN75777_c0_g1_i1:93-1283(-)
MARLKLHGTWEHGRRRAGEDKAFLADLVRASNHDKSNDKDIFSTLEAAAEGVPSTPRSTKPQGSPNTGKPSGAAAHGANTRGVGPQGRGATAELDDTRRPGSAPGTSKRRVPVGSRAHSSAPQSARTATSSTSKALRAAGVLSTPRPMSISLGDHGSIQRSCSPSVSRIPKPLKDVAANVPAWFRADGCPATVHDPFLPEYKLWVTLHGGDGGWKQQIAMEEWERQVLAHEVRKREWELREERERARLLEAERRRRQEAEEEERRAEEAEAERRRRREEEERRQMEADLQKRKKAEEEERQRRRRLPRPCHTCEGSGQCKGCGGRGAADTLYFATRVQNGGSCASNSQCGRLPRGCELCGGWGDSADWGEFNSGNGKCTTCQGVGKIQAPPRGWPT